jgi:ABC-type transport system involved in multi-copper enzyme maturation permease subunit
MSAVTAAPARPLATRPGLGRLTGVELRKMVDTRAGMWLLIATAASTLGIVAIVCLGGSAPDHVFSRMLEAAIFPPSILLPIIGILLVSSEWSQRTALVTFAIVPHRGRVLLAKLLAGTALTLAAFLLCIAVAAVATAIMAPDVSNPWSISAGLLLQMLLYVVTAMAIGVGFGALLLASAPGGGGMRRSSALRAAAVATIGEWLDSIQTLSPLTTELLSGKQWAQAIATLTLWMVVPLVAGWWRIKRDEVR